MSMFKGYQPDKFYDEMFDANSRVRPYCAPLMEKLGGLQEPEFLDRKATSELYFLRQGVIRTGGPWRFRRYFAGAV